MTRSLPRPRTMRHLAVVRDVLWYACLLIGMQLLLSLVMGGVLSMIVYGVWWLVQGGHGCSGCA